MCEENSLRIGKFPHWLPSPTPYIRNYELKSYDRENKRNSPAHIIPEWGI